MTTKIKVDSVQGLKGVKIRVPGEITDRIIRLLGGVTVAAPVTKIFELFAQGVVDGSVFNVDGYKNFRLGKYIKYVTLFPDGLYNVSFFLVMNRGKWDALPAQDQKAIMSVSGETFARHAGSVWDAEDKASIVLMEKNGVTITRASGAFLSDVRERVSGLRGEWLGDAKKVGVDGQALLDALAKEYKAVGGS